MEQIVRLSHNMLALARAGQDAGEFGDVEHAVRASMGQKRLKAFSAPISVVDGWWKAKKYPSIRGHGVAERHAAPSGVLVPCGWPGCCSRWRPATWCVAGRGLSWNGVRFEILHPLTDSYADVSLKSDARG